MKINSKGIWQLLPVAGVLFFTNCKSGSNSQIASSEHKITQFIDSSNFDWAVKPGEDFFMYANGSWIKNTEIPADKPIFGSFDELADRTDESVKKILDEAKTSSNDINESNIAHFYITGMDSSAINQKGIEAIRPLLDAIKKISSTQDFLNVVVSNQKNGINSVFGLSIEPDDKNVAKLLPKFYQAGLGLPNKDYYTDNDSTTQSIRAAYKEMIVKMLQVAGQEAAVATANAEKIFALEHKLALASMRPQEMRDPQKLYNKYKVSDFAKQTPNLNWAQLLESMEIKDMDTFIVAMPAYYKTLSQLIASEPLDVWKDYLTFHTINDMSSYLSDDISDLSFNFYGKKLKGQEQKQARWKRVKSVINGAIGEQLGNLYVKKNFQPEAKEKMLTLVNNLQVVFEDRIKNLEWMSETTKVKALAKLHGFTKKIGYPDEWRDYSKLAISKDNYALNVLNAFSFNYHYEIEKLGKPVNKNEWFMTPNTVNAYYNPAFNEIVFPAAILQFPFFDFGADDAINYGGIGAVIGHEMTHGFDDQGAQYAADGNLSDWWTPEDKKKFQAKTAILVQQYNEFKVLDSLQVNGAMTLGENIADLGGLAIAYEAFKRTEQGKSDQKIDGFTPDQRFFLSWAQIWRTKARPQYTMQLLKTDYHSPGYARANVPLSNFEPFYKAFDIKEGDKMYKPEEKRAKIW